MSSESFAEYELQYLKGLGPKRAAVLAQFGIHTRDDLINFFPRKYVDRTRIVPLNQLQPEQEVTVMGKIEAAGIRRMRKAMFYIVISDDTGMLEAVWFHAVNYYKDVFKVGDWVSLSGKVGFYRGFQLSHPDYDLMDSAEVDNLFNTGKIIPFYPQNDSFKRSGLNSKTLRRIYFNLFQDENVAGTEFFPSQLMQKRNFTDRALAYRQMHQPQDNERLELAIYRFKYEDFFFLQLMLALQRAHLKKMPDGIAFKKKSTRLESLYQSLPFEMTAAQKKVVREIRGDMRSPSPMNRLLQGDVGAGKTLVAVMALLIALDNDRQAALMAPTEILAEQHFLSIRKLLEPLKVKVLLLTGSATVAERKQIVKTLEDGKPCLLIGTHALIQKGVGFKNLGLVVIDEQHRFGVLQRGKLIEQGANPDVLVMTATPIPRTLALTAYGSLDVSVIDEMPAHRKPVTTAWRFENKATQIYEFISERITAGEQAYIVYPLVEESEKLDLKAASEGYEFLSKGPFSKFRLGLLHGRMKASEKEDIMHLFNKGEIDILVSTTVIEVGVDVANVTVMLIEHAERFGLSQLHQLRGRVGRSAKKSYCFLKTPYNIGDVAQQRMKIMTQSNDGFLIAEEDLRLRGWGDFFGTRQSGMPEFKLANPILDREILEQAREDAFELIASDSFLRKEEHAALNEHMHLHLRERLEMINIS